MTIEAGYVLYDSSNPLVKYYFDKSIRGVEDVETINEQNRLELKTFGKFPYIYYAGETDYGVFELTTVFIPNEETGESARQQVDALKKLIRARKVITIENGHGQKFKCDVQITEERSPKLYSSGDMEYIEVSIKCTEIDL